MHKNNDFVTLILVTDLDFLRAGRAVWPLGGPRGRWIGLYLRIAPSRLVPIRSSFFPSVALPALSGFPPPYGIIIGTKLIRIRAPMAGARDFVVCLTGSREM